MFKRIAANWRRWLPLTVLTLAMLYLVIGFWGVPLVARHIVLERINRNFNGAIAVERIAFNPLTLRARLEHVNVSADEGEDPLSIEAITLQVQAATLWRAGLHIAHLDIDAPALTVAIDENGQLNLMRFLDTSQARVTSETFALPVIHVGELRITDGQVRLIDALFDPVFEETLVPLNLTLHDLRTIPGHDNVHHFEAQTLGGDTIVWEGTFDVYPLQARGRLTLMDIQLENYFLYVASVIPILVEDATLWLTLDYDLKLDPDDPMVRWTIPQIRLADLVVTSDLLPDAIYSLKAFEAKDLNGDLAKHQLQLAEATVREGRLTLNRETDGTLPLLKLISRLGQPDPRARVRQQIDRHTEAVRAADPGTTLPAEIVSHPRSLAAQTRAHANLLGDIFGPVIDDLFEPWDVQLGPITIEDQSIRWFDAHLAQPLTLAFEQTRLNIDAVESRQGLMIPVALEATLVNDQTEQTSDVQLTGQILPLELSAAFHLIANQIDATLINHYWKPWVAGTLASGLLDIEADLKASVQSDLSLKAHARTTFKLDDLAIEDPAGDQVLAVEGLAVHETQLDWPELAVDIHAIEIFRPSVRVQWEADGTWNLQHLMAPAQDTTTTTPWPADQLPAISIARLKVQDAEVRFTDEHLASTPQTFVLAQGQLLVENVHLSDGPPATLTASGTLNDSTVQANGTIQADQQKAALALQVQDLDLRPVNAYWHPWVAAELVRGQLRSLEVNLAADLSNLASPELSADGSLALADLLVQDEATTQVLTLAGTELQNFKATLEPMSLTLARLEILAPRLDAGIDADGSLSLMRLLRQSADDDGGATAGMDIPQITIDEVLVKDGAARLHERHHSMGDFMLRVDNLQATVRPLSTQPDVSSALEASLLVNQQANVRIHGTLVPMDPLAQLALDMQVEGAGLKPFEPYFARFGGYEVDRGTAYLNLDYRIDAGQLQGANAIRLDRTYLGRSTNSPDRLQVPLKLGMDLLRNRQEQINVDIPVRGDLTDPRFSIQGLVLQAIGNVIERIVSSPFDLLAGLVPGASAQELSFLPREALQVNLGTEDGPRLTALAQAMQQRPALRLVIIGVASESVDGGALLQEALMEQAATVLAEARTDPEHAELIALIMQDEPDDNVAALRFLHATQVGQPDAIDAPEYNEAPTPTTSTDTAADQPRSASAAPAREPSRVEIEESQVVAQISDDVMEVQIIRRVVEKQDETKQEPLPETSPQTQPPSEPALAESPTDEEAGWPSTRFMIAQLLADKAADRETLNTLARERAQVVHDALVASHNLPDERLVIEARVLDEDDPADDMTPARVQFRITD